MIVLLVILLVLVLICLMPVGIRAVYSGDGPEVKAVAGPVSILVYPRPKKENKSGQKQKEDKKPQKTAQKTSGAPKEKEPIGGKIEFFKELLGLGLQALGCIRRKLILRDLKLYLTVGSKGEDAAKGAITYGRAWAAVGALTPVLENTFRIKNRDIQVGLDYLSDKNVIYAEGCVVFLVGDILWIALYYGIRALKIFLRQKQKGSNTHGTSHQ